MQIREARQLAWDLFIVLSLCQGVRWRLLSLARTGFDCIQFALRITKIQKQQLSNTETKILVYICWFMGSTADCLINIANSVRQLCANDLRHSTLAWIQLLFCFFFIFCLANQLKLLNTIATISTSICGDLDDRPSVYRDALFYLSIVDRNIDRKSYL